MEPLKIRHRKQKMHVQRGIPVLLCVAEVAAFFKIHIFSLKKNPNPISFSLRWFSCCIITNNLCLILEQKALMRSRVLLL